MFFPHQRRYFTADIAVSGTINTVVFWCALSQMLEIGLGLLEVLNILPAILTVIFRWGGGLRRLWNSP